MIQHYHHHLKAILDLYHKIGYYNTGSLLSLQKPLFSFNWQIILTFLSFQTKSEPFQFKLSIWQVSAKTPIFNHKDFSFFD